jgi:hypothetical protein
VYACLYRINVHAQELVDALRDVSGKFSVDLGWHVYQEALVQYVRASATRSILTAMTEIEHTEAWVNRNGLPTFSPAVALIRNDRERGARSAALTSLGISLKG